MVATVVLKYRGFRSRHYAESRRREVQYPMIGPHRSCIKDGFREYLGVKVKLLSGLKVCLAVGVRMLATCMVVSDLSSA